MNAYLAIGLQILESGLSSSGQWDVGTVNCQPDVPKIFEEFGHLQAIDHAVEVHDRTDGDIADLGIGVQIRLAL